MSENLELRTIGSLKGLSFIIPFQQRGYRWTPDNIEIFLKDLESFINSGKLVYCLQPITVSVKDNSFNLIDGQQRLTTIYLLHKFLFFSQVNLTKETELYHYEYERDVSDERKNLLLNKIDNIDDKTIDAFYITRAYKTLEDWFKNNKNKIDEFKKLIKNELPEKSLQIIWYVIDSEKDHEVFRNINSGKIQLSNSDLIKALLLNRENKIDAQTRMQIAVQYEQMERQFDEDRFWYMLQREDVDEQKGQSRLDLLFNYVANIKDDDYKNDARQSFYVFSNNDDDLLKEWKKIREEYQRLKDIFDDPYTYHYVAFLIYCGKSLKDILQTSKNKKKSEFRDELRNDIKKLMLKPHKAVEDYGYWDKNADLCKLFVLHNIETILQHYSQLKENKKLRFSYEYFPFELLYSQTWNIEHIASQTDNNLVSENDRRDWIDGAKVDYEELFQKENINNLLIIAEEDLSNKENFNNLYNAVITEANDTDLKDEKDQIGNLVLLDEHTNKSFHNSLFPRKRRIVLMASGLRNNTDRDLEENVESVYIPICTQQVYTKSYCKTSSVKLLSWNKEDFDVYLNDIKEKLAFYFDRDKTK